MGLFPAVYKRVFFAWQQNSHHLVVHLCMKDGVYKKPMGFVELQARTVSKQQSKQTENCHTVIKRKLSVRCQSSLFFSFFFFYKTTCTEEYRFKFTQTQMFFIFPRYAIRGRKPRKTLPYFILIFTKKWCQFS